MFKQQILTLRRWNRARLAVRQAARKGALTHPHRLGVLAIVKNESMNLDEWVEHYLWMGAGKIYLIDNGSTDDTVAKAKAWVAKGKVELVEYPQKHRQRQHQWAAFQKFTIAAQCQWLLIADADEFWFCPGGETLAEALADFDGFDVIYANCATFGSSGLTDHPASIRQSLTLRSAGLTPHKWRKYLCRTSVLTQPDCIQVHSIVGACSSRTVSDNLRFQLNHYVIQSVEFFQAVKMTRGDAVNSINDTLRDMDYFRSQDAPCSLADTKLAQQLALHRQGQLLQG